MPSPRNVADYRELARRRLPRFVFDYIDGGAEDESALARNRAALEALRLLPRALVDVSRRSQQIDLFREALPSPMLLAPTGLNGLIHASGDLAVARAAAAHGLPFIQSSASTSAIEEVARVAGGHHWFQLYVLGTRGLAENLMRRADQAGCRVLVLTVDVPLSGARERDLANGFRMPFRLTPRLALDIARHPRWAAGRLGHPPPELVNLRSDAAGSLEAQAALLKREMDASLDWSAVAWVRAHWPHRLLLKGILRAGDATRAAREGIDGVIVSNHGGRQFDAAPATFEVLQEIAGAAGDMPVLVDGGIRRGVDVLRALALGARAVLLGRAALYGLAAGGEAGVAGVLRLLREEIDRNLALLGCPDIRSLGPEDLLRRPL